MKLVVTLFLMSAWLGGCLDTRDDIRDQEEKKVLQGQVNSIQRNSADHTAHFQEIQEELRALTGRIEVMESQMSQLSSRQQKGDGDSQKLGADLNEKIRLLTETISGLQNQLGALQQQADAAQSMALAQEQQTKINRETATDKGQLGVGNQEFDKKNFKKAIVAYEKYRSANPKGKSYPLATLRIGASFQELGMKQEARAFYEEVLAKFPKSDEAKRAQSHLKQLK